MMIHSRFGLGALLVALWCLPALAQDTSALAPSPPAVLKLTLEEAVEKALRDHPDVISAQAAAVRARATADEARADRYPRLDLELNGRYSQSLGRPVNIGGGTITTSGSRNTTRDADVALTYVMWQTGRDERIERAKVQAAAQQLGIDDARRLLAYEVRQACLDILAARRFARALLQSVAASERHREQVQARIEAGTAPESDLLPIQVEVAQTRLQAVEAETALEVSIANLRALLQVAPETAIELADPAPVPRVDPALSDLLTLAEQNRPDLTQQLLGVRAARLGSEVAEAQRGVQVTAQASGDYGRHTGVTGESWALQIGATYPLFDGGASRAAVTSARADETTAGQRLLSTRLDIQREVQSAQLRLRQSAEAIEVAELARRNAENSLAAAEARYQEGLAIIIEVTDAQVQLLQAQVSEIRTRYEYAAALASLAYSTATDLATLTGEKK